jgi:hypothetical protein
VKDDATPTTLAEELGISPKTLRAWLRARYPQAAPGQGGRWTLSVGQVEAARARWAYRH